MILITGIVCSWVTIPFLEYSSIRSTWFLTIPLEEPKTSYCSCHGLEIFELFPVYPIVHHRTRFRKVLHDVVTSVVSQWWHGLKYLYVQGQRCFILNWSILGSLEVKLKSDILSYIPII